jgi:hypothetical protein
VHRRAVIALLGGATISWPLSLSAQQVSKTARIGVFTSATDNAVMGAASRAFLDEMHRLHYNTVHPHRTLSYRSPREFIASRSNRQNMSDL